MRATIVILFAGLLFVSSGCAALKTGGAAGQENLQLQNKVNVLEAQLKQKQDENAMLRQQLAKFETQKTEVRMPTGKEIQTALKKAGYYKGEIDGQIGSKTKETLQKFQAANGLTADGVVGSRTWAVLSKYLN